MSGSGRDVPVGYVEQADGIREVATSDDPMCVCGHTMFWHQKETGLCLKAACHCPGFREVSDAAAA